jgi:hypothetical protein
MKDRQAGNSSTGAPEQRPFLNLALKKRILTPIPKVHHRSRHEQIQNLITVKEDEHRTESL